VQKDPTMLSTTHQETPQTTTQPQAMNVYHDDNHEPIQLFDEVVFARTMVIYNLRLQFTQN
jgi:hypothetical protein